MSGLAYARPASLAEAARRVREGERAEAIAGGTDLLQRLEENVAPPALVVDLTRLDVPRGVEATEAEVRLGALTTLAEAIDDPTMRAELPAIVEALTVTASPQVRNLATVGGNPFQKTRCLYFRDVHAPCEKRAPGSGCGAMQGRNRLNAILGASEKCIATHASDFAVAMVALEAVVEVEGPEGRRELPFGELHREPGDEPWRETNLAPGEIVTGYRLPRRRLARQSHYFKVRDRAEFEWAICSAAVALELEGDRVADIRVAAGGVATKPWRLPRVEAALRGEPATEESFRRAAARATEGAQARGDNAYKVELLPRTIVRALSELRESL